MITRIFIFVMVALASAAAPASGAELRLEAVEIAPSATGTTLRLGFDAAPAYSLFTLNQPDRLLIDLPETAWDVGPVAGAGLAAGLRYGLATPGVGRIVVDLAEPAAVVAQRAEAGSRLHWLTLTLAPRSRAAFDAATGWPAGAGPQVASTAPERRRLRVALDPGHGGADGGAVRAGVVEKWVALDFATRLAARLRAAGFEATLTREGDEFVPLAARVARARRAGADVFLSIHADTVSEGDASGASVYTLSETASDALAADLAARSNAVDALAGGALAAAGQDVASALIAMVRRDTRLRSEEFAEALIATLGARIPLLASRPHRRAGFRVLKAPDTPSALLEIGFLSNAADRRRLGDPAWRNAALEGVVEAVRRWSAEDRAAQDDATEAQEVRATEPSALR